MGAKLRLDAPALDTHRALVEADILVMSKGAFSYTTAVLNEGIVVYDPQKYRALQDWVVRAPDGALTRHVSANASMTASVGPLIATRTAQQKTARAMRPGRFRMNIERGDDDF